MRVLALALAALAGAAAAADNVPRTDDERLALMRQQAEEQKRLERAREACLANRGVDCDTPQGLQEWVLLDRTRAEAVLDRVFPRADQPRPPVTQR